MMCLKIINIIIFNCSNVSTYTTFNYKGKFKKIVYFHQIFEYIYETLPWEPLLYINGNVLFAWMFSNIDKLEFSF